jgi:predicted secreted hydrolase
VHAWVANTTGSTALNVLLHAWANVATGASERYAAAMPRIATLFATAVVLAGCIPSVYDQPYPVVPVELPGDDAAHAAPIEWWYWVGHLETADGRELAFQLTFFEAYAPPQLRLLGIPSNLLLEKGIVAHAAAADLGAGRHGMAQRFDAYYESGASTERLDVFVGDWRATRADDGVSHALAFTVDGYAFDLVLTPTKPASLHGDPPGIQSMGPGGVSYYVAHTRMDVRGEVRGRCAFPVACAPEAVLGQAWFDHQWGDFRVDALTGWDWFALQLDDGAEVMLYLIRDATGGYATSAGSYVTADGRTLALAAEDFVIEPTGARWISPDTGAVYPAGWRVAVPAHGVDVEVAPRLADQEMDTRATTTIVYWEGAVVVTGSHPGIGFVELTNYDRVPFAFASSE